MTHTVEELQNQLHYDPFAGVFYWLKNKTGGWKAGLAVGYKASSKKKYIPVTYRGKHYLAHRLAWALYHGEWPSGQIDHIDGNPFNNRIDNLRIVSARENMMNQKKHRDGRLYGAHKRPNGRYTSLVRINNKLVCLGTYDTAKEAHIKALSAVTNSKGEIA